MGSVHEKLTYITLEFDVLQYATAAPALFCGCKNWRDVERFSPLLADHLSDHTNLMSSSRP